MTDETQVQYIHCNQCGSPVTVKFVLADPVTAARLPVEQPWTCPHGCGLVERPELHGRIIDRWAGHTPTRALSK
jgi:hypothetical protein